MSRASSTIAISIATSLITSSLMFLGLQFWLVPQLKQGKKKTTTVEVPKIVGLRTDDAKIILENKGLLLTVSKTSPHPTIKAGLIHSQIPLAGSLLKKDQTVSVETSSGIPMIPITLVVGKTLIEGRQLISSKGLLVVVKYREDSVSKPGQILSQDPPPGKGVLKGSVVNLVVAKASGLIEVPDFKKVRLRSKKKMAKELKLLKLELGKVRFTDQSDRSNGYIYSHKPKKGEKVPAGTKIDFVVQYAEDDD
jgi:eukaryotic-like serine/threonine-protein kinase